jgi:hypothetical protein
MAMQRKAFALWGSGWGPLQYYDDDFGLLDLTLAR